MRLFDDQAMQWHRGAGELGYLLRPLWMLQESRHSGQRIQRPESRKNKKLINEMKKKRKFEANRGDDGVDGTQFH